MDRRSSRARPKFQAQVETTELDLEQLKTLWRGRSRDIWQFYCPLCRGPRRVPYRPRPGGARQISQVAMTAVFFTLVTWSWFGWKGMVSFIPFWTIFEAVYRSRVRAALGCPQCGFDPYLYLVDVGRARSEIEGHWKKKFAEKGIPYPTNSLTENPPQS
jgi:hypothetical protein